MTAINLNTNASRAAEIEEAGGKPVPTWYKTWEKTGLLQYEDKNGDGIMQYRGPNAPDGVENEVNPNRDIFVLANPQIAQLPGWVIGLVVAGGLAAALSTAAGLLMVISSAVSHDICRRTLFKDMDDKTELRVARFAAAGAVICAGLLGLFASQLGFVAQVVAFAFGLAASSLFPIIFLGIFWKRMNKEGAIASMCVGLITTFSYIYFFKFGGGTPDQYFMGVSPEGIGFVFMFLSLAVGVVVSLMTAPPPQDIQDLVEDIRVPGARKSHGIADAGMAPAE
jgi:cation/acetate symporter